MRVAASVFSPRLLVPLTMLTPYVFVLHYGITVLELIVLAFLCMIIVPSAMERELWIPRFLLIFYSLFGLGYLGALINGVMWRVPIGLWNLNVVYKMLLAFGAFLVAYCHTAPVDDILKHRLFKSFVVILGLIALVYPFLTYSTKIQFFGVLYPPDSGFERYFTSRRMPGLGINANVYSFIVLSYLLIAFRAFLDRTIAIFVPLTLFFVILVLSSKLIIVLAVAGCAMLTVHRAFRLRIARPSMVLVVRLNKRGLLVMTTAVAVVLMAVFFATQTATGKAVVDSYATVKRFEAIIEKSEPGSEPVGFALRVYYWKKGLKRAELAPFLGIARDPFLRMSGTLVGFYNPHNEFLRMWILYGLLGLCAWLYLLAYMTYKNHRHKAGLEWIIIYGCLAVFMFFDGGLDDPRVTTFLFLLIGLNWRAIERAKANESGPRPGTLVAQVRRPTDSTPDAHGVAPT